MVHIGKTKTTKIRCIPEIALKAPNSSGGYYFMNIFIRKRIHRYNWKEFPITEVVIEQVERFSGYEGEPIMGDGYALFQWDPYI